MKGLLIVFKNTRYTFLAFFFFLFFVFVITLLPNIDLLKIVLFSSNSLAVKIEFIFSLLFSFRERASLFSLTYTLVISVLSAVSLSLSIYVFRRKIHQLKSMGLGFLGTLATFLGIGCMACGSLLLTTIATYFGIGTLIVYLPYKGEELGFIGILLLIFSIYYMSKNVDKEMVCKV